MKYEERKKNYLSAENTEIKTHQNYKNNRKSIINFWFNCSFFFFLSWEDIFFKTWLITKMAIVFPKGTCKDLGNKTYSPGK